jgi:hypothetical protein
MAIKAVLTGDLIRSRKTVDAAAYVDSLRAVLRHLRPYFGIKPNTFRGDGFQVVPHSPGDAFRCALALRAGLIGCSPAGERWDARVAVGIGSAERRAGFGEAYVMSGQGLDTMKKSTLAVFSKDAKLLERVELATAFAATIIDKWTVVEAQTFYVHLLQGVDQKTTAAVLGKSRVSVNKALQRAQARLLERYLNCTQDWIEELTNG